MINSTFENYIKHIDNIPHLSLEEELIATPEQLIMSHLKLVITIVKKYPIYGSSELMDLVQDGNEGLIYATKVFDKSKCRFSTIAKVCVWRAIQKGLKARKPIKISEALIRNKKSVQEMIESGVTDKEICEKLNIKLVNIRAVINPHFSDIDKIYIESEFNSSKMLEQLETTKQIEKLEKQLSHATMNKLLKWANGWSINDINKENGRVIGRSAEQARLIKDLKLIGLSFNPALRY